MAVTRCGASGRSGMMDRGVPRALRASNVGLPAQTRARAQARILLML